MHIFGLSFIFSDEMVMVKVKVKVSVDDKITDHYWN